MIYDAKTLLNLQRKTGCPRIPVTLELYGDFITPVEAARILAAHSSRIFLLESASHTGQRGRYSYIGYQPDLELILSEGLFTIRDADGNQLDQFFTTRPEEALREIIRPYKTPKIEGLPGFTGGLCGYFAYEYLRYDEPDLVFKNYDNTRHRDMDLMLFNSLVIFDHFTQKIILLTGIVADEPDFSRPAKAGKPENEPTASKFLAHKAGDEKNLSLSSQLEKLEKQRQKAQERLQAMKELLESKEKKQFEPLLLHHPLTPLYDYETYCAKVEKARCYIREGDIFQAVFSNPMQAPACGSLFDTYRQLRSSSPSPYMFYLCGEDIEIAGASPETLVRVEDRNVFTCPLAGTRKRGATPEEDARLKEELLADEKELAEHNMLVDLGRNDLGRICQSGSVQVSRYMDVLPFASVMHIGSQVQGVLEQGRDALDSIGAILPAGTLSGAPKFRACQIIEELEQSRRGVYGGAIGHIDFTGGLDLCIGIRLACKQNGVLCVRSGGGIVFDSSPEAEYQERTSKARAIVSAVMAAQGGLE